jgi:chitinase
MKKLLFSLPLLVSLLVFCDKPAEKFVIPTPGKPSGQQGGNSGSGSGGQGGGSGTGGGGGSETGTTPQPAPTETVIVGYATYWDSTIPDPTLLTHLNYAFAHIKGDFETLDIKTESRLRLMVALKKQNPALKVLLSVGGWEAGNFSEMAASETHRKNFCKNCLTAVTTYGLDGIDIDWEYPTSKAAGISASPDDTQNFTLLMRDLRETLGKDRLLTMASASNAKYVNFKEAVPYMDFVNVMTYDMGDPPKHNAALYRSSRASESCDESVTAHVAAGVPLEKIVLGIPFYGHGDGKAFDDYVDYRDISINTTKYRTVWDNTACVPFVVDATGQMVLTYDNEQSVGLKAEYIAQKNLCGAMYWNIEADDANWTLSRAIASRLLKGYVAPQPQPTDDPDAVLVTNAYVQKYLEEVNYPVTYSTDKDNTDKEYSYSLVMNYPGGGPGEADIPPAHQIQWTSDASSGAQTLKVWESKWSREYTLKSGTRSQDLINLVPGREYHYKVTASGGKTVTEGTFKTKGLLHQVYFEPNGRNGRDLGGLKGLGGKTLAYRKLFRGGAIHGSRTNSTGKANMRAEGIKAEVDLREASDVPSKSPLGEDIAFLAPGFDSGYNEMIKRNQPKVKETFCFVVQCLRENKPVYFHCAAGRDRTGTLAVLLEGALGVSESDMAKDYELTYFSPRDWSMSRQTDDNDNYVKDADGNYIWYYGHVRNTYSYKSIRKTVFDLTDSGTYPERIVKYLLKIGVPQKDIDDLRSIMLE